MRYLSNDDDRHNPDVNGRNSTNGGLTNFTSRPSRKPSNRPTVKPTIRKSEKPSKKPTSSPKAPTKRPTIRLSARPTKTPTSKPSVRPSSPPTTIACQSSTGSVGISTNLNFTLVYNYQMELSLNVTPDIVIPYLEVSLTNLLVKTFYSQCGNSRLLGRKQQRMLTSSISLVGISSAPVDLDMSSAQGNCPSVSSKDVDSTVCYPIKGGVTFYFSFDNRQLSNDLATSMATASNVIQSSMDNGSLNYAHPSIISLKYVDDGSLEVAPPSTQVIKTERTFPLMIALVVVGVTVSLVIALFTGRRLLAKKRRMRKRLIVLSDDIRRSRLSLNNWEKYDDSIELMSSRSPQILAEFAQTEENGFYLSSESVIVKIDRRILEYDRIWPRNTMCNNDN